MNISIQESENPADLWKYINILIKECLYVWILHILIIKMFSKKSNRFIVVKNNKEIIGGFFITKFPYARYKPYNWFRFDVQNTINLLVQEGYNYFSCFIIRESFRNKGVGKIVFDEYLKKNQEKIWFTSSIEAKSFYARNGARILYKSKYDIYILN
jgi:hypothetical protein